jgi:DNA-binding NarL/FixJ family response regulator
MAKKRHKPKKGAELSPREKQVVDRVVKGWTTQEIADDLGVCYDTIKLHLYRIRTKLGVRRTTQIATWAVRHRTRTRK